LLTRLLDGEMESGKLEGFGALKFRNDETGEYDQYLGNFVYISSTPVSSK